MPADGPHSAAKSGRVEVVEALRGLAAVAVALFHFSTQLQGPVPEVFRLFGWAGVDAFFVISGFVVPYAMLSSGYRTRSFPAFMLRRMIRLEPPYVFSIVLTLLMWHVTAQFPSFAGQQPDYSWLQVASHLLYVIPLTGYAWLSPVYWSLAYEFVFYITVGLFFEPLIRRNFAWTAAAAAVLGVGFYVVTGGATPRICEFLIGIAAMRILSQQEHSTELFGWSLLAMGVTAASGGVVSAFVSALTFAAIIAGAHWRMPEVLQWLGGISYSLYLIHVPIGGRLVNLGHRLGSGSAYDLALLASALALSLIAAAAFAAVIERPAIRASRLVAIKRDA